MIVWKAHKNKVRSLAFSPDGTRIATTAGDSKFVWLWDATSGKSVGKLTGPHYAPVRSVVFFPDARHIAGHLEYNGIRIWDLESQKLVALLSTPAEYADSIAVSPDGSRLLTCLTGSVTEWDEPTRPTGDSPRPADRTHQCLHRGATRLAFSPLGTWFCVGEWLMHLHDPITLADVRALRDPGGSGRLGASVTAFAFTPDESRLAVGLGHRGVIWQPGNQNEKPVQIPGHGKTVKAVGFLPGGHTLLTAGMDGTVRIWDVNTGEELRSFDWGIGKVQAAAVSPDGTLCAAGSDDGRMVVWDVDT